jgi:hypothetical protein
LFFQIVLFTLVPIPVESVSARHHTPKQAPNQIYVYGRRGIFKAIASEEQLARISSVPKREFMRRGINQHTLEKICKQIPVLVTKLSNCMRVLEEYEREKQVCLSVL